MRRVEGLIKEVQKDPQSGDIKALLLESGELIEGDLFIDCTGFRSCCYWVNRLGVEFEDWSHWLFSDRAIAVQTNPLMSRTLYPRNSPSLRLAVANPTAEQSRKWHCLQQPFYV